MWPVAQVVARSTIDQARRRGKARRIQEHIPYSVAPTLEIKVFAPGRSIEISRLRATGGAVGALMKERAKQRHCPRGEESQKGDFT